MTEKHVAVLDEPIIRAELKQAWTDSLADPAGVHEEGGFILRDTAGALSVVRWPKGEYNTIIVPPHSNCMIDTRDIVATFHTHPNTGSDFLQEPSETDKRSVRADLDKRQSIRGEFVISLENIYLITPNGQVNIAGDNQTLFAVD